jgi:hypothetical protein
MTFREKHLWITVVTTVGIWGFYFWSLIARILEADLRNDRLAISLSALFVICLLTVVLVEVVLTLIATATTRKAERQARDEREIIAALKASHVALMGLIAMVFCIATGSYFAGLIGTNLITPWQDHISDINIAVILANVLLACLVITELVRAGLTLGFLGRGR